MPRLNVDIARVRAAEHQTNTVKLGVVDDA